MKLFPLVLMLVLTGYGQTKEYRVNRFGVNDGMSQSSANCIYQDRTGFIWIGTQDGLNRFDGYEFVIFRNDPSNPHTLSNNHVQSIIEDDQGFLWIATQDGLSRYDPETRLFKNFNSAQGEHALPNDHILSLFIDSFGILWVGTQKGICRYDPDIGQFTNFHEDSPKHQRLLGNNVNAITEIKIGADHFLWIGTNKGANVYNYGDWPIRFTHYGENSDLPFVRINDLQYESHGESQALWMGTSSQGIVRYDLKTKTYQNFLHDPNDPKSLSSNGINKLFFDKQGILWVVSKDSTLNFYQPEDQSFTSFVPIDNQQNRGFPSGTLNTITQGKDEIYWIGSILGIFTYDPNGNIFRKLETTTDQQNLSLKKPITSIFEDEEYIWLGSFGQGLTSYDRETKEVIDYGLNPSDLFHKTSITKMVKDPDDPNKFYLATLRRGLLHWDRKTNELISYLPDENDPNAITGNDLVALLKDERGFFWIATSNGVSRFNAQTKRFFSYKHNPDDPTTIADNQIQCLTFDHEQRLWVGFLNHGIAYKENNKFKNYTQEHHPFLSTINSIYQRKQDKGKGLWLGSGHGLLYFDIQTEKITAFTTKEGLANNSAMGIIDDEDGNLWISTNEGLSRFVVETQSFQNFSMKDGLLSQEFVQNAIGRSKDGTLMFGTIAGLNLFSPSILEKKVAPPIIQITDFLLFNSSVPISTSHHQTVLKKAIERTKSINLKTENRMITFEFAALHYSNPDANEYAFKLEGFDTAWVRTSSNNRRATYTNLDPGAYTFKVKGSNKYGVWSNEGPQIKLLIQPSIWNSKWAKAAYFMFLLCFMWLAWNMFSQRKVNKTLERVIKKRTLELIEKNQEVLEAQRQVMLQEKMASLGLITAGVAHEISNPTNFAHFGVENLERDLHRFREFLLRLTGEDADPEVVSAIEERLKELNSHTGNIRNGTQRVMSIVRDLQAVSKMDKAEKIHFDVNSGLKSTINLVKSSYEKSVNFNTNLEGSVHIKCWPSELNQVFMNLMVNGCQAIISQLDKEPGKEKGNLYITTERKEEEVMIQIRDEGCGMPKEVQERIFEPFFTTKDRNTGTGLGLSISFGIIEKHQGRIEVASELGKGSTFSIYLPLNC